ncbi:MAG: type II toxin-antitoxin system RelE/ParE family toxin [Deltaproteobacteria bacterium]|nr:type II toxin-antitoxin system RelE/ParE family toxin [Deltaproteobacteria bacterium]
MYKLKVSDDLKKFILSLHPELKRKIKSTLKLLIVEPCSGKPLKDELEGLRSIRVGKFRIIYRLEDPMEIHFVAIGPRSMIYEETYLLIKKESKMQYNEILKDI